MASTSIVTSTPSIFAQAAANQHNTQCCSFFTRLPREMRDAIYELALLNQKPFELAPMAQGGGRTNWAGDFTLDHWGNTGSKYHVHRYRNEIRPRLGFLGVCKQINGEATPVMYGQPFRFTSEAGFVVLYNFLTRLPQSTRAMIRDITVGHPALLLEKLNHPEPMIISGTGSMFLVPLLGQ